MARILIVDDEAGLRDALRWVLEAAGHEVQAVGTGEAGIEAHTQAAFEGAVLDITLPGISGVETLTRLRAQTPDLAAVFITAHSSIPSAVEAMRAGGFDYVPKPFDNDELVLKVARALEHRRLTTRVRELESDLRTRTQFVGIVGQSPALHDMTRQLARVASTDVTVLLTGESGTGKELAAVTLHRHSQRAGGPFIPVNCGAITASLAESELFGHERGAFTDAKGVHRGVFERADGGTLFLDEVGELPLDLQVKLLRVIETREVVRVGGAATIRIDARIVAATNRHLKDAVREGRFRDDLYWRLCVFPIALPPLRERRTDIPLLVDHLLTVVNAECGTRIRALTPAAQALCEGYAWPGNIRQLHNVLRHAALVASGTEIDASDLPSLTDDAGEPPVLAGDPLPLVDALLIAERQLISQALSRVGGNRDRAAIVLGISRRALYDKLKRWRLNGADEQEP